MKAQAWLMIDYNKTIRRAIAVADKYVVKSVFRNVEPQYNEEYGCAGTCCYYLTSSNLHNLISKVSDYSCKKARIEKIS